MPSASLARTEQVTADAIQVKHLEREVGVSGQEEALGCLLVDLGRLENLGKEERVGRGACSDDSVRTQASKEPTDRSRSQGTENSGSLFHLPHPHPHPMLTCREQNSVNARNFLWREVPGLQGQALTTYARDSNPCFLQGVAALGAHLPMWPPCRSPQARYWGGQCHPCPAVSVALLILSSGSEGRDLPSSWV